MRPALKEGEISQKLIEDLLTSFLCNAVGLDLHQRIEHLEKLPGPHRERLEAVEENPVFVAWVTNVGVVSATGRYDADQSRRTYAHVLLIDWWLPSGTHHSSWWRANPQHLNEWTAGRG
jgi:hypothetical protein